MKKGKVQFDLSFATYADIEDIENLLYPHYFEESTYSDLTYDPEMTRKTITSWIPETCILARVDGVLVGVLAMYFTRTYYKEYEGDVVIFYVHPDYRGAGVGRGLVNALKEVSDKLGAAVVYTSSGSGMGEENNKLYTNLFKKVGFEELGTELIRKNV